MESTSKPSRCKILFYSIIFLINLICIELTAQLYYFVTAGAPLTSRVILPIYDEDSARCYKLKPNLHYEHKTNEFDIEVFTNSQGWRTGKDGVEFSEAKPPGVYRIMVFGPSFTFGWGNDFEDIWPTLTGKQLAVHGKTIEVINLGTPAQPQDMQWCWFEKVGFRYKPDLIVQTVFQYFDRIVGTCSGNLICPVVNSGYVSIENPTLLLRIISVLKSSGIVFYSWYFYQHYIAKPQESVGMGTELYHLNRSHDQNMEIEKPYRAYAQGVRQLVGREVPVVFLYIPVSFMIRPQDLNRFGHLLNNGKDNDPYRMRAEVDKQVGTLQREGFVVVNPLKALIRADQQERMYYFLDTHLTKAGNRVVAEELAPILHDLIR